MKKIISLFLLTVLCFAAAACGKKGPLVYNLNKSDELREYESEIAEASLEEESSPRETKAPAEPTGRNNGSWQKQNIRKSRTKVKGIYLTDHTAGSDRMDDLINKIESSQINAVVIDVKDDEGRIAFQTDSASLHEIGSETRTISDIASLMRKLKSRNIYTIARIVCFRDPFIEKVHPEWMNLDSDGSVYHDSSGFSWVNPYQREYWNYIKEIIHQCAAVGFDECQFDYVRFCTESTSSAYPASETGGLSRVQIITEFVHFVSDCCAKDNVFSSADVFGTIIGSYVDSVTLGQDYLAMSDSVDYMCPMIYPSHYSAGYFGIDHPDIHPYDTIFAAMKVSASELSGDEHAAVVRPWIQAFTASYLGEGNYTVYGMNEIQEEVSALEDSGCEEWLAWNASSNYNWDAFSED